MNNVDWIKQYLYIIVYSPKIKIVIKKGKEVIGDEERKKNKMNQGQERKEKR